MSERKPSTREPSARYLARAKIVAEAIDIGLRIREAAATPDTVAISFDGGMKHKALHPEPVFARLASLKFLEEAVFGYWREGSGPDVEQFWREVAARNLPFARRDTAKLVLERGRIRNAVEYEAVTDAVGDARFSRDESEKLQAMLEAYGNNVLKRRTKKKK